jgi:hypothetical protein
VKVLAFPAASSRTVQGLMQLFNIDQASAERLIADVPLLLSQQVTGPEAEACAQSLRKLGARVVVEPAALPTAHQARWSQPSELEEHLLPQPRAVPIANDTELEYDVLSAQEPSYAAHTSISTGLRDDIDLDMGARESELLTSDAALRRPRQDSLDLEAEGASPELELAAPTRTPERKPGQQGERARPQKQEAPATRQRAGEGPAPHARAGMVRREAPTEKSTRALSLLQLCFALAVAAIGFWSDSSVIYGSANLWSVIAHGVALYQLFLGVRGLAS